MPSRRNVREWDTPTVLRWLGRHKLSVFAPTFARENVTGLDLVENLNKASLEALGIPHCDTRAQLLSEVKRLRQKARELGAVSDKPERRRAHRPAHHAEKDVVSTRSLMRRPDRSLVRDDNRVEDVRWSPEQHIASSAEAHRSYEARPPRRRVSEDRDGQEHLTLNALHKARLLSEAGPAEARKSNRSRRAMSALSQGPHRVQVTQATTPVVVPAEQAQPVHLVRGPRMVRAAPRLIREASSQPPAAPAHGTRPPYIVLPNGTVQPVQTVPRNQLPRKETLRTPRQASRPNSGDSEPERLTLESMKRALASLPDQREPSTRDTKHVSFAPDTDNRNERVRTQPKTTDAQFLEDALSDPTLPDNERKWLEKKQRQADAKAKKRERRARRRDDEWDETPVQTRSQPQEVATHADSPALFVDDLNGGPGPDVDDGNILTREQVDIARRRWKEQNRHDGVPRAFADPDPPSVIDEVGDNERFVESMKRALAVMNQGQGERYEPEHITPDSVRAAAAQQTQPGSDAYPRITPANPLDMLPRRGPNERMSTAEPDFVEDDSSVGDDYPHGPSDGLQVNRIPPHDRPSGLLFNEFGERVDPSTLGVGGPAPQSMHDITANTLGFHIVRGPRQPIGFAVEGGSDVFSTDGQMTIPPFISKVNAEGQSFGTVRENDLLISINGQPCAGLTKEALENAIEWSGSPASIVVRRPPRRDTQIIQHQPLESDEDSVDVFGLPSTSVFIRNYNGETQLADLGDLKRVGLVHARSSESNTFVQYRLFLFESAAVLTQPSEQGTINDGFDFVRFVPIEAISHVEDLPPYALEDNDGLEHGWILTTSSVAITFVVDSIRTKRQWMADMEDAIESKWTTRSVSITRPSTEVPWDLTLGLLDHFGLVMISHIDGTNIGAKALSESDVLADINGMSLSQSTPEEVRQAIDDATTSYDLTVRRIKKSRDRNRVNSILTQLAREARGEGGFRPVSQVVRKITLVRSDPISSFGFGVGDDVNGDMVICNIIRDSPADGVLCVGDEVLEINGQVARGKGYGDVVHLVQNSTVVELKVSRLSAAPLNAATIVLGDDESLFVKARRTKSNFSRASTASRQTLVPNIIFDDHPTSDLVVPSVGALDDRRVSLGREIDVADDVEVHVTVVRRTLKDSFGINLGATEEDEDDALHVITAVKDTGCSVGKLFIGDTILSVNGVTTRGKSHQEVIALIQATTELKLVIARSATNVGTLDPDVRARIASRTASIGRPEGDSSSLPQTVVVQRAQDSGSYGFTVGTQPSEEAGCHVHYIERVNPTGVSVGRLVPGDIILSVNGQDVEAMSQNEVEEIMTTDDHVDLVILRDSAQSDLIESSPEQLKQRKKSVGRTPPRVSLQRQSPLEPVSEDPEHHNIGEHTDAHTHTDKLGSVPPEPKTQAPSIVPDDAFNALDTSAEDDGGRAHIVTEEAFADLDTTIEDPETDDGFHPSRTAVGEDVDVVTAPIVAPGDDGEPIEKIDFNTGVQQPHDNNQSETEVNDGPGASRKGVHIPSVERAQDAQVNDGSEMSEDDEMPPPPDVDENDETGDVRLTDNGTDNGEYQPGDILVAEHAFQPEKREDDDGNHYLMELPIQRGDVLEMIDPLNKPNAEGWSKVSVLHGANQNGGAEGEVPTAYVRRASKEEIAAAPMEHRKHNILGWVKPDHTDEGQSAEPTQQHQSVFGFHRHTDTTESGGVADNQQNQSGASPEDNESVKSRKLPVETVASADPSSEVDEGPTDLPRSKKSILGFGRRSRSASKSNVSAAPAENSAADPKSEVETTTDLPKKKKSILGFGRRNRETTKSNSAPTASKSDDERALPMKDSTADDFGQTTPATMSTEPELPSTEGQKPTDEAAETSSQAQPLLSIPPPPITEEEQPETFEPDALQESPAPEMSDEESVGSRSEDPVPDRPSVPLTVSPHSLPTADPASNNDSQPLSQSAKRRSQPSVASTVGDAAEVATDLLGAPPQFVMKDGNLVVAPVEGAVPKPVERAPLVEETPRVEEAPPPKRDSYRVGTVLFAEHDYDPQPDPSGHHEFQLQFKKGDVFRRIAPLPRQGGSETEESVGWSHVSVMKGTGSQPGAEGQVSTAYVRPATRSEIVAAQKAWEAVQSPTKEVNVDRSAGKLGLAVREVTANEGGRGVAISNVDVPGIAHDTGHFEVGMRIYAINGRRIPPNLRGGKGVTKKTAVNMITASPPSLTLTVDRTPTAATVTPAASLKASAQSVIGARRIADAGEYGSTASAQRRAAAAVAAEDSAAVAECTVRPLELREEIELQRGTNGSLGIKFFGGRDKPRPNGDTSHYIEELIPGGVAALDSRLRSNDKLVEVNGTLLEGLTHAEAASELKGGDWVKIVVSRQCKEFVLHKAPSKTFGMKLDGGKGLVPRYVLVTGTAPGGPAETMGIPVMTEIVQLNGIHMQDLTHIDAKRIIQSGNNTLRMVIIDNDDLTTAATIYVADQDWVPEEDESGHHLTCVAFHKGDYAEVVDTLPHVEGWIKVKMLTGDNALTEGEVPEDFMHTANGQELRTYATLAPL
eukprot:m.65602 g.65602  ORF g.65602 m.65602 type:complete len:2540 (-) comp9774_c0_seq1:93-7712(-)